MLADLLISGAYGIPVAITLTARAAFRHPRPRDRRPFGERYHQDIEPWLRAELGERADGGPFFHREWR